MHLKENRQGHKGTSGLGWQPLSFSIHYDPYNTPLSVSSAEKADGRLFVSVVAFESSVSFCQFLLFKLLVIWI